MSLINKVGIVVIGRNEGERLKRCLRSIPSGLSIVYVDSGSTDGSYEFAESMGCELISLDMSIPFSAGRARNEGFNLLTSKYPFLEFIQFIDGDCEFSTGWIETAANHLAKTNQLASVCGQRCEIHPEATLYNRFCDLEWDTPVGLASATGGDFMIRASVFRAVGGFNPSVIAGEEPEMCFRIRDKGWLIERVDHKMTYHDADIQRFSQWWSRAVRCGHAYAQGYAMHGQSQEKYYQKPYLSSLFWAGIVPSIILILSLTNIWFFLGFAIYPLKIVQVYLRTQKKEPEKADLWYITFNMIAKAAELQGISKFLYNSRIKKEYSIIEYKA